MHGRPRSNETAPLFQLIINRFSAQTLDNLFNILRPAYEEIDSLTVDQLIDLLDEETGLPKLLPILHSIKADAERLCFEHLQWQASEITNKLSNKTEFADLGRKKTNFKDETEYSKFRTCYLDLVQALEKYEGMQIKVIVRLPKQRAKEKRAAEEERRKQEEKASKPINYDIEIGWLSGDLASFAAKQFKALSPSKLNCSMSEDDELFAILSNPTINIQDKRRAAGEYLGATREELSLFHQVLTKLKEATVMPHDNHWLDNRDTVTRIKAKYDTGTCSALYKPFAPHSKTTLDFLMAVVDDEGWRDKQIAADFYLLMVNNPHDRLKKALEDIKFIKQSSNTNRP